MHSFVYLMLAIGTCLAYYRDGFDLRNLIEREEPQEEIKGELVECPVCAITNDWFPNDEECPFLRGSKRYKICTNGTYFNTVCGNRKDCYRVPGERCTEKMEYDTLGQKCAPGYYCDKNIGKCTGPGYKAGVRTTYLLNPGELYTLGTWNRS